MVIKLKEFLFFILSPIIPSFIISSFIDSKDTYSGLVQPSFAPPSTVFPIMWTILYILMGISSYIIYISEPQNSETNKSRKIGLTLYFIQLFFNFIWTPIFFGLNQYLLSFFIILLLIVLLSLMIYHFTKVNKYAGLLQIPYLLWLIFAAILNFAIYSLN